MSKLTNALKHVRAAIEAGDATKEEIPSSIDVERVAIEAVKSLVPLIQELFRNKL